jgi:hypothetical protein
MSFVQLSHKAAPQRLNYFVSKEEDGAQYFKRRYGGWCSCCTGKTRQGKGCANGEVSTAVTETSPLTEEPSDEWLDESTTIVTTRHQHREHCLTRNGPPTAGNNGRAGLRRRKSRRSPQQACEAQLDDKIKRESTRQCYKWLSRKQHYY